MNCIKCNIKSIFCKNLCRPCYDKTRREEIRSKTKKIKCACGTCDEWIYEKDIDNTPRKYCSGHHLRLINMFGENNPNYKGGRYDKGDGYWSLYMSEYFSANKHGRVPEHVYFFQEYHKCCMLPWGVVHHIIPVTKDYYNNMIWNLMGMMERDHLRLHKTKNTSDRRCRICGSNKTRIRKNGRPNWLGNEIDGWICFKCYQRIRYHNKCGSSPINSFS